MLQRAALRAVWGAAALPPMQGLLLPRLAVVVVAGVGVEECLGEGEEGEEGSSGCRRRRRLMWRLTLRAR